MKGSVNHPRSFVWSRGVVLLALLATPVFPAHAADQGRPERTEVEQLVDAAGQGDGATFNRLIDAGVNPGAAETTRLVTPLHNAAAQGHEALVRRLLELGVDIDAADWNGATAIVNAAYYGHSNIVSLLIDKGARLDSQPQAAPTVVQAALYAASRKTISALLAAGADPSLKDHAGRSAIDDARASGRMEWFASHPDAKP